MDDSDWPRDEYDCLAGPLLTLLQSGVADEEIGNYLRKEIVEHFGLSPDYYDFIAVAARLRTWFECGWRNFDDPVTIFVALLDEGVDVWRPVQARPLSNGLFRIVGVDADVSDETWQFPAGAIVKCEERQLEGGLTELIAIEQIPIAG